jgi:hypothetical protein
MPSLTPDDRHRLLGPAGTRCPECHAEQVRHYCRSCDAFFLTCVHLWLRAPDDLPHISDGHRVYVWMGPGEITAVPDFDDRT